MIIKRFLFDFVNFYSALVYIAFFKGYIAQDVKLWDGQPRDSCATDGSCLGELAIQLAIVFVGKQLINQTQEIAIPILKKWWNKKNELAERAANLKGKYKTQTKAVKPPQWAKDDLLPAYNPQMFEEYRELVIQFGFCTLFVTAFPIAPIFALLNNILEIRVDAYKVLTQHKRPIAQGAQDIGMVFVAHFMRVRGGCYPMMFFSDSNCSFLLYIYIYIAKNRELGHDSDAADPHLGLHQRLPDRLPVQLDGSQRFPAHPLGRPLQRQPQ